MKQLKEFTIPFVGLKLGTHQFEYKIENAFFDHFEHEGFNSTDVNVEVELEKKATLLDFRFKAKGSVNVNCDLTNEPYDQDIANSFDLVVKFGDSFNDDEIDILVLPQGEHEVNIQQYVYELIVLAVPTKLVHPGVEDGTLQSEMLKKLEELSPKENNSNKEADGTDPRWNTLKKLLTDK